jgi:IPT/TIG domain
MLRILRGEIMAHTSKTASDSSKAPRGSRSCAAGSQAHHFRVALAALVVLGCIAIPASRILAQNSPSITAVDPTSGKVNDSITVTGQNLGKPAVAAVFLSDDKNDYKAVVVQQANDKIVLKVPDVKPGAYNVSIQEGTAIYIQPVRFHVE